MKIFLASFLEPDNFGPGRIIGVVHGDKPTEVECTLVFPPLTPSIDISKNYEYMRINDPANAADTFVKDFTKQLDTFRKKVEETAQERGCLPMEVLPFKEGDTIASWERERYTNYRPLIGAFFEKLGYEVVQH